jgi:hypothetical protein
VFLHFNFFAIELLFLSSLFIIDSSFFGHVLGFFEKKEEASQPAS